MFDNSGVLTTSLMDNPLAAANGQLLDRIGELIDMQQQVARAIEALGFLALSLQRRDSSRRSGAHPHVIAE